jgi:hypothetical protein
MCYLIMSTITHVSIGADCTYTSTEIVIKGRTDKTNIKANKKDRIRYCTAHHSSPFASAEDVVRGTRSLSVKATKGWYHTFNRPSARPTIQ